MDFHQLRTLRKLYHYTQEEVANELFVAQNTYSQYETGTIALPLDAIIRLADFYGLSVDYLIGYSRDKTLRPMLDKDTYAHMKEEFLKRPLVCPLNKK